MMLYHYCSLETFKSIIENKTLRLSNVLKSNDSEEFKYFDNVFKNALKNVKIGVKKRKYFENEWIKRKAEFMPLVLCLSSKNDQLSQWRGYADDGRGIALGFDFEKYKINENIPFKIYSSFDELLDHDVNDDILAEYSEKYFMADVRYGKNVELRRIVEHILYEINDIKNKWEKVSNEELNKTPYLTELPLREAEQWSKLLRCSIVLKKNDFIEENESRVVVLTEHVSTAFENEIEVKSFLRNNQFVTCWDMKFSPTCLRNIVLGSKCNIVVDDRDLKIFLAQHGFAHVTVESSRLSYR